MKSFKIILNRIVPPEQARAMDKVASDEQSAPFKRAIPIENRESAEQSVEKKSKGVSHSAKRTRRAVSMENRENPNESDGEKTKDVSHPAKRARRAVSKEYRGNPNESHGEKTKEDEFVSVIRTRRAVLVENQENGDQSDGKQSTKVDRQPVKSTRRNSSIKGQVKANQPPTKIAFKSKSAEISNGISVQSELLAKCLKMSQSLFDEKNKLISLQQACIEINEDIAEKEKKKEYLQAHIAKLQEENNENINILILNDNELIDEAVPIQEEETVEQNSNSETTADYEAVDQTNQNELIEAIEAVSIQDKESVERNSNSDVFETTADSESLVHAEPKFN